MIVTHQCSCHPAAVQWNSSSMLGVLIIGLCCAAATAEIRQCEAGYGKLDRPEDVVISNCPQEEAFCKLKRRTNVSLEAKFTPKENIDKLTNKVHATLLGIPFPFLGVDGTSACDQVYNTDGSKASCPLEADKEYVYKNSFKVLDIYPKVKLQVHWSLNYGQDQSAICFEVPARITS